MARTLRGTVVSAKTAKTVVVAIQERRRHKLYDKQYTVTKRLKVHDEAGQAKEGDRVRIVETRPQSRHKRWTLGKVLTGGKGVAK